MDHQAPYVNGKNGRNGAAEPLTGIIGDLGHHFSTLVELQLQLISEDAKEAAQHMMAPVKAFAIMAVLGLAGTTVLMFGIAELLVEYTDLMRCWAFVIVALVGLLIGVALVANAMRIAKRAPQAFQRSKQEFLNNIRAINSIWRHPTSQSSQSETSRVL